MAWHGGGGLRCGPPGPSVLRGAWRFWGCALSSSPEVLTVLVTPSYQSAVRTVIPGRFLCSPLLGLTCASDNARTTVAATWGRESSSGAEGPPATLGCQRAWEDVRAPLSSRLAPSTEWGPGPSFCPISWLCDSVKHLLSPFCVPGAVVGSAAQGELGDVVSALTGPSSHRLRVLLQAQLREAPPSSHPGIGCCECVRPGLG